MAQRQVTTVLQMLAQRQAAQAHAQAQTQVQAQVQVQPQTQHNPYQSTVQPLTFAELAARQEATAPVASVKVQELLVQQQQAEQQQAEQEQAEQEQVVQPQTAQPPAYAVNPYLDPDVEMPPPEPFDISSLDYADHPPVNPLAGAQHASKVNDPVYDQVYL